MELEENKKFGELQLPFQHRFERNEIFPPFERTDLFEALDNFRLESDDVIIATFPKSGTTWTQKIIHSLHEVHETGRFNDTDGKQSFMDVIPWLEKSLDSGDTMEWVTRPRYFKTHTSYRNVVKEPRKTQHVRYIYIARNPKDTCVSLYHHCKGFKGFEYNGEFTEFAELFLKGHVESSDWWGHVKEYYVNKDNLNILFLKYEDLHTDPRTAVELVNTFCCLPCLAPSQVEKVVKDTTFKSMTKNPSTDCQWMASRRKEGAAPFLRKGLVGDWKEYFSDELSFRFDQKTKETFEGIDLNFRYE